MRKTQHEFLGWYLARLPPLALSPYLPLIQLQISSALSHIFPAIRIDACKLVELLLETHADDVVANWPAKSPEKNTVVSAVPTSGSTIFDGLRLSAGLGEEKGASSQGGFRLTAGSKLVILRTIKTFVSRALESSAHGDIGNETGPAKPKLGEWTLSELNVLPAGEQWSLQTTSDWGVDWELKSGGSSRQKDLSTGDGVMEELSVSCKNPCNANSSEYVPRPPLPPPLDFYGSSAERLPSLSCCCINFMRRCVTQSVLRVRRVGLGLRADLLAA